MADGLKWQLATAASRGTPDCDREVVKSAFDLPRPTADRERSRRPSSTGGRIAVVTVSAVTDGDYAALTETDSNGDSLANSPERSIGNEEFTALFVTLRRIRRNCERR